MVHVIEGTNEVKCECLMWIWRHEGTPQGETHASVSYLVPQSLSRKENRKALREGGRDSSCFYHSALEPIQVGRVAGRQSELEIIAPQ